MTLDEELLAAARKAGTLAAAAQDQADISKAVYHHSVLRLHRAGGSMREIAEALKMSHQRVHQIVEQSKRTERCWFCGRVADDVDKLMAGPAALICARFPGATSKVRPGVTPGWRSWWIGR